MASSRAAAVACRRGFTYRLLLALLVMVIVVPAVAWSLWPTLPWSGEEPGPMMVTVQRDRFIHDITDRGEVESANNVEVRCEVKSKGQSGTQILDIVSEGTIVKKGDVLVRLDGSLLENDRTSQLIVCHKSEAAAIEARNVYEAAMIAKREYLEGTYEQEVQAVESEIFVAEENLSRAEEYLAYSERLAAKGYVTAQQLKADRFAVDKASKDLEVARTKLQVLQQFTRAKMLKDLESDIKTAEAKLKAAEAAYQLDTAQLELIENQLKKCVVCSPEEGQVVYANVTGFRGNREVIIAPGEMARERQVLIRLPDPKRMQVLAKINEAKVTLVKVGMPATIRLDAFGDMELHGRVEKINEFPLPTSWMGSSVKEYETIVSINDPPLGLRPGLTAEVKIHVEDIEDAILLPVQAVFQHGSLFYCVLSDGRRWKAQEVLVGSTNDQFVVIRKGLEPGQQVVLHAAAYRGKVKLPELPPEQAAKPAPGREPSTAPAGVEPGVSRREAPAGGDSADAAAAAMFAKLDRDGDGRLEKDQLPEQLQAVFASLDADGDVAVDRREWGDAAARLRSTPAPPKGAGS